jgi:hypothetical protein
MSGYEIDSVVAETILAAEKKMAKSAQECAAIGKRQSAKNRSTANDSAQPVEVVGETVRRERRWTSAGATPVRNWLAPPGSNGSGSGGNEVVGAFGVEGHFW